MMNRFKFGALALATAFSLAACSQNSGFITSQGPSASPSGTNEAETTAATLTITDTQGTPVAGARVMIGTKENVPFPGNILTSNSGGRVVAPAAWTDAQPVTIDAPGFVRATYFGTQPLSASLVVTKTVVPQRLELRGTTTGFGRLNKDGFADVGVVFPALSRASVATLSVTTLVSPEIDTITVFGQKVDIPSNITIPRQTEDYIFPITLEKSAYRAYLPTPGAWKMVATRAKFPFKRTIDDVRGGSSFFDIINTFEFVSGGITDVTLTGASQTKDLPVETNVYAKTLSYTAPRYDQNMKLLAVALAETNGLFYVTDVKSVAQQANVMLATPRAAGQGLIVAALRRPGAPNTGAATEELSAIAMPANQSTGFEFLETVTAPSVTQRTLNLDAPRAIASVTPVLTYGVLNKVTVVGAGRMQLEQKSPQWQLFSPAWASRLELPEVPALPTAPGDKLRWEVSFGGQPANISSMPAPGPAALGVVSHISRSALDL